MTRVLFPTSRFLGSLLALFLLVASGAARAAETQKDSPTVMSPYEVRANSVAFQGWIKRVSPNFIVYTDGSESDAATALRQFEMLRQAGQAAFGRVAGRYSPTIIILPSASSDWRKLETKRGAVEWKTVSVAVGGQVVPALVAQYDWQALGLGMMQSVYAAIEQREMDIEGPFWLQRGLNYFYETVQFDGNQVRLGRANPRIFALQDHPWIPWGRFFEVNPSSPEFTKEKLVSTYEAQVALFTQFLFSNPDRIWVARLVAWLDYLRSGSPPIEAQFAAIFGQDWKKWQDTMRGYLFGGSYNIFRFELPSSTVHFQESKPELPVKEIRELFILIQTLLQNVPDSQVSLNALLTGGLQSPCLRELLIESCLHWQRPAEALQNVRQLIAAGSTNARVYRLGDLLLTGYAGALGPDCRFGPEITEVRAWDRRGLALEPLYSDLNDSLAFNEACAPLVDQQSITTIEGCYLRLKGRAPTDKVITSLAIALWRMGESTTAAGLAAKLEGDPLVAQRCRNIAADLLQRIGDAKAKNQQGAHAPVP